MRRLGRRWILAMGFSLLAIAIVGGEASQALHLRAGNLIVDGDGGFAPRALPENEDAPIRAFFHGRISTLDGARPSPLTTIVLEIDKHSLVETEGLSHCSVARLEATTTPQARKLCPGAIVGTGRGTVVTELPEQAPITTSSAVTIFNGPNLNGMPTAIGHAHINYPGPTTYLTQSNIERIRHGRYGYRIVVNLPPIANYYGSLVSGSLTLNRRWNYRGKRFSYANARCADGRLQAHVDLTFKDTTHLSGTAFKRCTVRE